MTRRPYNSAPTGILVVTLAISTFWASSPSAAAGRFIRGDANQSGDVDMSDAIRILGWRFRSEPAPDCLDAADANDDGNADLSDTVYLLSGLFRGAPPPTAPFPECGEDPTDDDLDCLDPSACSPTTLRILGRVVDVDGAPLDALSIDGGIVISIGEEEIQTDDAGSFSIERERGGSDEILLSVSATGFTSSQRIVHVVEGRDDYQVAVTLLEVGVVVVVEDPADGVTIDVGGESPARVVFPAGAIASSGPVRIAVTALDPTRHPKATPGDNLRAVDPEGGSESITLESFGMMEVTITDVESEEEIHELDAPALMELPVPDSLVGKVSVGDIIPLWYLDEATALWVQEGESEVLDVDGRLILSGEVTHFTWWNCDIPMDLACIRIEVSGRALELGVEGLTYAGRFRGNDHSTTTWDLQVLRSTSTNQELSLLAADILGQEYYLEEIAPGTLSPTLDAAQALVLVSPTTSYWECLDIGSYVIETDLPPFATLSSNYGGLCVGEPNTITMSVVAADADGEIVSISWSADPAVTLNPISETLVEVEVPDIVGEYFVSAVVSDDDGNSSEARRTILVGDCAATTTPFIRGDVNGDGRLDLEDAIVLWSSLPFLPAINGVDVDCNVTTPNPEPFLFVLCDDAADANDDGLVDCGDGADIIASLFENGAPLPMPTDECGEDLTADGLGCGVYPCQ